MKECPSSLPLPEALGLDGETLAAFYQPIIAMDTRKIIGYEVLGRAVKGDSVRSLGPFFCNAQVAEEDHIVVDRLLREQAFSKLAKTEEKPLLFINLKPSWIYRYEENGELYTLSLLDKYGIDPKRIVIEITEESFHGSMEGLRAVVDIYRSRGCLIAIDDVGSGFSSTDRIAHIQPNLLKIDIHMIKKSATHDGYFGVLRSFSDLAEQIGASLLVEGVETREDLSRSIQAGARYVQGFMFARAEPEFREPDCFATIIESELEQRLLHYLGAERYWQRKSEQLAEQLVEVVNKACVPEQKDDWIELLLHKLYDHCIRVYLCNEDGIQLSSNYYRESDKDWQREEQYRGANWSWRPYFVPNLVLLNENRRAIVSRAYTDLESHAWIRTVSVLVAPGLILFMDFKDTEREVQRL
ncbi:EAL domain-containing protein [Paenibacillus sp. PL91]|uniref:EAL domain-containing protein n=1 Tax=Paenibacillus sp. PL91 TaxID=2729538 RepID=UPI00145DFFC0|nr:EAL domain-containing protein [Paenibacillus sp. PL91]MBC9204324.1 EAL domain-containing protein [Paenibacillus sp. PL91]